MNKLLLVAIGIIFVTGCLNLPKRNSRTKNLTILHTSYGKRLIVQNIDTKAISFCSNSTRNLSYCENLPEGLYQLIGTYGEEGRLPCTKSFMFLDTGSIERIVFTVKDKLTIIGEARFQTSRDWTKADDSQKNNFKRILPDDPVPEIDATWDPITSGSKKIRACTLNAQLGQIETMDLSPVAQKKIAELYATNLREADWLP